MNEKQTAADAITAASLFPFILADPEHPTISTAADH